MVQDRWNPRDRHLNRGIGMGLFGSTTSDYLDLLGDMRVLDGNRCGDISSTVKRRASSFCKFQMDTFYIKFQSLRFKAKILIDP